MAHMKILVTTYHQAFLSPGGGEAEMIEMAQVLRQLGLKADIYGHTSQPLSSYDLVLHFSAHGGGEALLTQVKQAGKRVVLVPNLALEGLSDADRQTVRRHFDLADKAVFRSRSEQEAIAGAFGLASTKASVVPLAVDPCFGEPADEYVFPEVYGARDYILWVGIIEERKNQLGAIEALRDIKQPVIFVGNYRDRAYYDACRRAAPAHFKFVPYLTPKSEALRSAYQNCRLYLEVSKEPPGVSALEAGLAGAPLVLTDCAWSHEYFNGDAILVDPSSANSIRAGVERGLSANPSPVLKNRIARDYVAPNGLRGLIEVFQNLG